MCIFNFKNSQDKKTNNSALIKKIDENTTAINELNDQLTDLNNKNNTLIEKINKNTTIINELNNQLKILNCKDTAKNEIQRLTRWEDQIQPISYIFGIISFIIANYAIKLLSGHDLIAILAILFALDGVAAGTTLLIVNVKNLWSNKGNIRDILYNDTSNVIRAAAWLFVPIILFLLTPMLYYKVIPFIYNVVPFLIKYKFDTNSQLSSFIFIIIYSIEWSCVVASFAYPITELFYLMLYRGYNKMLAILLGILLTTFLSSSIMWMVTSSKLAIVIEVTSASLLFIYTIYIQHKEKSLLKLNSTKNVVK
ncbi:hypothetical protein OZX69_05400 [Lactobacillus sp. ESL0731]|uniref:hypothetical protein n=1 Tax=unclassified Lactobacillus TaxID=2620435 RepID=UPI0023F71DB2|nr:MULTISPECIES: hypothetical protein [unclassified Lactobacillus]WEV50396.1 hypothetical protein OZX63_05395 [Lactobacillus sp. ESL0700]WEV61526.1 hypothetical protein OZX69_05400 [Lactobacillus sp. ESL0731]